MFFHAVFIFPERRTGPDASPGPIVVEKNDGLAYIGATARKFRSDVEIFFCGL